MLIDHLLGLTVTLAAITFHTVVLIGVVRLMDRSIARGWLTGHAVRIPLFVVGASACFLVSHVLQIVMWAVLFRALGAFDNFSLALYNSGQNYTTLGYGDDVLPPQWRMLGPIEAMNGLLAWGLTTAVLFAGVQRLQRSASS